VLHISNRWSPAPARLPARPGAQHVYQPPDVVPTGQRSSRKGDDVGHARGQCWRLGPPRHEHGGALVAVQPAQVVDRLADLTESLGAGAVAEPESGRPVRAAPLFPDI
jgi:hypothetical protein